MKRDEQLKVCHFFGGEVGSSWGRFLRVRRFLRSLRCEQTLVERQEAEMVTWTGPSAVTEVLSFGRFMKQLHRKDLF